MNTEANSFILPSFRATGDEKDVTRGRANILRELLTNPKTKLVFDQKEIMDALELCTSCKACKSECPSNVDMTRYKAEFLQHHYDVCHTPLRSYAVAHMADLQKIGSLFPPVYNFFASNRVTSGIIKKVIRFTPFREIPLIDEFRLKRYVNNKPSGAKRKIALFLDEFTRYNEKDVVEAFLELVNRLGYEVVFPKHHESLAFRRLSLKAPSILQSCRLCFSVFPS